MSLLHFAVFLVNSRSDLALHTEHLDILVMRGLETYDKNTEDSWRPSSKSAQTSHPIVIPHINRLYHKSYKQQTAYRLHTAGQNSAQQFQPNRRFATICCKDKTLTIFKRSRGKVFVLRQGIRKYFWSISQHH
jgi:hypothetical protein